MLGSTSLLIKLGYSDSTEHHYQTHCLARLGQFTPAHMTLLYTFLVSGHASHIMSTVLFPPKSDMCLSSYSSVAVISCPKAT